VKIAVVDSTTIKTGPFARLKHILSDRIIVSLIARLFFSSPSQDPTIFGEKEKRKEKRKTSYEDNSHKTSVWEARKFLCFSL